MMKQTVIYGRPLDPLAFDAYYLGVHVPLALEIPNLVRLEVSTIQGVAGTEASDRYYAMAELYFEDEATMAAASTSEESLRASADVPNFATGGAVVTISEIVSTGAVST